MVDNIIVGKTRTRRQYSSYYTNSTPILSYMINRLGVADGDRILEPCAGSGLFVDVVLQANPKGKYEVAAYDLNPKAVESLNENIHDPRVKVVEADTLFDVDLDMMASVGGYYTKVIGNPPYGAWQDTSKRKSLKEKYGGYVKETYTLFIKRCLSVLKEDGKLVFIVPDTFLALSMHRPLRKYILENCFVDEVCLFPSKFFPGVNFGYSNLCIITLTKSTTKKNQDIKILSVTGKPESLLEVLNGDTSHAELSSRNQDEILKDKDHSFMIGADSNVEYYLKNISTSLGDLANCVTGFYSGDNQAFLSVKEHHTATERKHRLVEERLIEPNWIQRTGIIDGLDNGKKFIPFLKGGQGVFRRETSWYIEWTKETVAHYKSDKKARFQNSRYYFTEGIAVPMVRGKKLRATLIEKRLFDQSVVGIFPKKASHLNYLLAFLNSDVCNDIVSAINHTANNSANYLKKIPVHIDNELLAQVDTAMNRYFEDGDEASALNSINLLFSNAYAELLKR